MDLKRNHNPDLIILLESRICASGASSVCKKMVKTHWICSEAIGFSGSVWILWSEDVIKIELLNVHQSFIHVEVKSAANRS